MEKTNRGNDGGRKVPRKQQQQQKEATKSKKQEWGIFRCDPSMVPRLIGKGGSKLAEIQRNVGKWCNINGIKTGGGFTGEFKIVADDKSTIQAAQKELQKSLDNHREEFRKHEGVFKCDPSMVTSVIGYGGSNLDRIKKKLGFWFVIDAKPSTHGVPPGELRIRANDKDAIQAVQKELKKLVEDIEQQQELTTEEEKKQEVGIFNCDPSMVPRLVGKGGSNVAQIQRNVGQRCMIFGIREQRGGDFTGDLKIVADDKSTIQAAQKELEKLLESMTAQKGGFFRCDPSMVPRLIGKGGSNVAQIQRNVGQFCYISAIREQTGGDYTGDIKIVADEMSTIRAAQKELKKLLGDIEQQEELTTEEEKKQEVGIFNCDPSMVPRLIGKGGSNVAQILRNVGQWCVITAIREQTGGDYTGDLKIVADEMSTIQAAQKELEKLLEEIMKAQKGGFFRCDPSMVPRLIGKGGSNITQIKRNVGKWCVITAIEKQTEEDFAWFRIVADDMSTIEAVQKELKKNLDNQREESLKHGRFLPSSMVGFFTCDPSMFPAVIGRGGSNLDFIKKKVGFWCIIEGNPTTGVFRIVADDKDGVQAIQKEFKKLLEDIEKQAEVFWCPPALSSALAGANIERIKKNLAGGCTITGNESGRFLIVVESRTTIEAAKKELEKSLRNFTQVTAERQCSMWPCSDPHCDRVHQRSQFQPILSGLSFRQQQPDSKSRCKSGAQCWNYDCEYNHPCGWRVCEYRNSCLHEKVGCTKEHPPDCVKEGCSGWKNRKCKYSHPPPLDDAEYDNEYSIQCDNERQAKRRATGGFWERFRAFHQNGHVEVFVPRYKCVESLQNQGRPVEDPDYDYFLALERLRQCPEFATMALKWASLNGHHQVVKLLLEHYLSVDVNAEDDQGMTALHWASQKGHQQVVTLLMAHPRIDAPFVTGTVSTPAPALLPSDPQPTEDAPPTPIPAPSHDQQSTTAEPTVVATAGGAGMALSKLGSAGDDVAHCVESSPTLEDLLKKMFHPDQR